MKFGNVFTLFLIYQENVSKKKKKKNTLAIISGKNLKESLNLSWVWSPLDTTL